MFQFLQVEEKHSGMLLTSACPLATSIFLTKIFSFLCLLIAHFPNIIWNEDPGSNLGSNQKRKLYCHLISYPQSTHICDCPLVLKLLCKLLNYLIFYLTVMVPNTKATCYNDAFIINLHSHFSTDSLKNHITVPKSNTMFCFSLAK